MKNIWTIAKREYDNYFNSPLAYVVALAIFLPVGIIFSIIMYFAAQQASYGGAAPGTSELTNWFVILLLFFSPALTMRLLSDEVRSGTMELLLTYPVRDIELVIGKWLGAFLFVLLLVLGTLIFPIIMNSYVTPYLDWKLILSSYIGIILLSSALLALGVGISAVFNNQFAAFFATFVLFFSLWILVGVPANILQQGGGVFNYLSINTHFFNSMNNGTINLGDVVYFLSLTALGLFIGTSAVEIRRWR